MSRRHVRSGHTAEGLHWTSVGTSRYVGGRYSRQYAAHLSGSAGNGTGGRRPLEQPAAVRAETAATAAAQREKAMRTSQDQAMAARGRATGADSYHSLPREGSGQEVAAVTGDAVPGRSSDQTLLERLD